MSAEGFDARAARRRSSWAGTVGTEQKAVQVVETTIEQRVLSMQELSEAGWLVRGEVLPTYARGDMPGRVIRPRRHA